MKIFEEVKGAKTIGLSGHVRPDGDCIGSVMGLSMYLKKVCPDAQIQVMLEKPADIFQCIKGVDEISSDFVPITDSFDVFIALDSEKTRLGEAEKFFDGAKKTINIDHHISNAGGCGDANYVVPDASSASELVYDVIDKKELLDEEIAKALYIGIMHDTGVFQYSNTSAKTLKTVAELIAYGFDFSKLIDQTFYEKTHVQNRVLGKALYDSKLIMDGKCIVSRIDKETMDAYQVCSHDLDGIISQLRYTKGVECAIFMYPLGENEYKVSLRSNGNVDVAKAAATLGGGGHVRAAGVTLTGTYDEIVKLLSAEVAKQL